MNCICIFGVGRPGARHSFMNYDDDGWSTGKCGIEGYPDGSRMLFALGYVAFIYLCSGLKLKVSVSSTLCQTEKLI